jgi:hypothetical protein
MSTYTDYYLPSKQQLQAMYDELKAYGVGGLNNTWYWSSSELNNAPYTEAWAFNMGYNSVSTYTKDYYGNAVRAVREFIAPTGSYAMRSIGQAGGLIFAEQFIGGGDSYFYEAATYDDTQYIEWSNVTIGSAHTYEDLDAGFNNTFNILHQGGFTGGAAAPARMHSESYCGGGSAPVITGYQYTSGGANVTIQFYGTFTDCFDIYTIEYWNGSVWAFYGTIATQSATQAIIAVTAPVIRMYRIRARDTNNVYYASNTITCYCLTAPSALNLTNVQCSRVDLNWTVNSPSGVAQQIVQKYESGNWVNVSYHGAAVNTTAVAIPPTTTLPLRVVTQADDGTMQYSASINATTLTVTNPTGLVGSLENTDDVRLNWTNVQSVNGTIAIYRILGGVPSTIASGLAANTTTYLDTTSVAGNTYQYQVVSQCSVYSFYSNQINMTITSPVNATMTASNAGCYGSNGTIIMTSPYGGGGTYEYTVNGGSSWQDSPSFSVPAGSGYNVKIRDKANITNVTTLNASVTITAPAILSATFSITDCTVFGASDGIITVNGSAGGSGLYQYSAGGSIWQNSNVITGLAAGVYTVYIRDRNYSTCLVYLGNATINQPAETKPPILLTGVINGITVDLNWTNQTTTNDNIYVYRILNGVTTKIATLPPTDVYYNDATVSGGTKYFYYVAAVEGVNEYNSNTVMVIMPLVVQPTIELIPCNTYTIEGIKSMKLCTQQSNGQPINFPTNFVLYQNNDGIIQISENVSAQTVTITDQTLSYLVVESFDMADFEDNRMETRQGVWFEKKLSIVLPKLSLYCSNQLVDFLFNVDGKYAVAMCIVLVEDTLGNTFIIGYDNPCQLQVMELQTDAYDTTDNLYKLEFVSRSYSRLRRYQVV